MYTNENRKRINILGVCFDRVNMEEAVQIALRLFDKESKGTIFTPNPEIVMAAYENKQLQENLNQGSLVIPDGIGVIIGAKLIGRPLKERVAGYDLVQNMFMKLASTERTIYFYGAKPGVAKLAAEKMITKFPGLKIVGTWDGYEKDLNKVIEDINHKKPDFVLVGLGAPRQEQFIATHQELLSAKVFAGVGGSFDVMAGVVKRAPKVFIKLHLEWFYRLITQPTRIGRMMKLPLFLVKMLQEGKKY